MTKERKANARSGEKTSIFDILCSTFDIFLNFEYRTRNYECRRNAGNSTVEERLVDFAVRVIRTAESLPKTKIDKLVKSQIPMAKKKAPPIS